ncbi:FAD/FMN-containing dehydrogenase [Hoeflea marina]|uniref:FAD/FMN-containing dehydrogenase n=1 Tax=Hoeflea marina TaxID=274592 RepID=A0A317PSZ1_9HYPH|nr:FAD-binding oxidoreductase [Hoeflea marina]PWW03744.1 FAD/FMN-containing dehydrogenase [Hoeflea marina]
MNIEMLERQVRGAVISQTDRDYRALKDALIWNGRKSAKTPRTVVRAECAADVQAAVRYAAANGLTVSARGSGHHFALLSMQDGVLVDLSRINRVTVDADAMTAVIGPGITNGELAAQLAELGLAFPVGHCASVAVSGYMLGGGFGWNSGAVGLACHNVLEVEVVLADGSLVTASESENADIFWAARGAGPEFFGIVTRYRVRLYTLPRAIRTAVWAYPIDRTDEVERWMTATMATAPSILEFTAVMTAAPPPLDGKVAKVVSGVATVFADNEAEADAVLASVAALAPREPLFAQPAMATPFDTLYQIMGQFFPEGLRFAADTHWSADGPALMSGLAEAVASAPTPQCFALGVVLPPPPGPMPDAAFSMAAPVFSALYAAWSDASGDAVNMGWLRETSERLAPVSLGHYIGEADLERPERTRDCFAPDAWARLGQLQRRHDPESRFDRPTAVRAEAASRLAG